MLNRTLQELNSKGWEPLTAEQLTKHYPAVMATRPAGTVSGRYTFIPTIQVVEQFDKSGWVPVHVKLARTGMAEKEGFQKHIVRFRERGAVPTVNGLFPEIVLINSHDAGSAFILKAGVFRLVCSNGMVVGDTWFSTPRVTHVGYRDQLILEAIQQVGEALPRAIGQADTWQALDMTPDDRGVYGLNALIRKYGPYEAGRRDFDLVRVFTPHRREDSGTDLWRSFNVLQEKLVERGGRFERRINPDTQMNRRLARRGSPPVADLVKSRSVHAPDANVALNTALWSLTGETAVKLEQEGHRPEGRSELLHKALRQAAGQVSDLEAAKKIPAGMTKDRLTADLAANLATEMLAGRL